MDFKIIAVIVWLILGLITLAYILKHNIGRVLKGILIFYGILGVAFSVALFAFSHDIFAKLYHGWVTTFLFILIMLILAVAGR